MTGWAAATLIGLGAAAVAEGIWLMGRVREFIEHAKQLIVIGQTITGAQPERDEPQTAPIVVPAAPAADDEWRTQFQFKQPGDAE